ncbi:MAG: hypothetical protein FWG72_06550 [Oscillospiraceae bacterium]|nr:hypothetical protein [Oscillospiraceae bacterium]
MKQQYIPLEKRSKREQKAYFAGRRGSWGGVNPVTRKPPNPKAYNRKKSGQRYEWSAPCQVDSRKKQNISHALSKTGCQSKRPESCFFFNIFI